MKVLLTTLNAKYVHTNLAIRYLKKSVDDVNIKVEIKEFTINNSTDYIISEIYKMHPDVLCFSCYIWNIDMILHIANHIKKVLPGIMIILGGPEVSFETKELMEANDSIDLVVIGEGEKTFRELINLINSDGDYTQVPAIGYRARGEIYINPQKEKNPSMEELPFPYDAELLVEDKIIYYESSRGCPYNCQYCLSSAEQGVRYLPVDRVKSELKYFIDAEVRQVKFVDRTFNANKAFALEIMNFIMEHNKGKTNFHFEVTADILGEDLMEFLKEAPVGLFQFEIGVQSTNEATLKEIDRKVDFKKLSQRVKTISSYKNIHQHLDLIVGLPKEDYYTFRKSFEDVFELRPEKLQMGFLKLLKGSGLRAKAAEFGYVYSDTPPYEVMENESLSYGEIIRLKGIEEMVEIYWNSRIFNTSIEVIIQNFYANAFKFFEALWFYWEQKGYHHTSHGKNKLYEILLDFYKVKDFHKIDVFKEVLKFDFLKNTKTSSLPVFFNRVEEGDFKNRCHEFLQQEENVEKFLPNYLNTPAKQIIKKVHFEAFNYNVIELEEVPLALSEVRNEVKTVLFDYDLSNKALDHSRYYEVSI
ncbi:B12-binding domain-containing radical SAM protein [Alkaliphilus transvaalensis]|uniref:B12-binding domain-containing radical SAM protein n=1 Tax=Alkaliphilus transvaalensis TaxID=114628 RepID=UPI0004796032|nr:B12-binding domain-containing radical SAM protein [Alkaliphilus transvaalensis]